MNPSLRLTLSSLIAPALLCMALLPQAGHAASVTGSGRSASESRDLAEFQAIVLSGSMDLVVRQGTEQSVQVAADDNLLPLLETVVETTSHGATLQVRWKKGSSMTTRSKVLVSVLVPRLTALVANGSGDLRVEQFSTPVFNLSLTGSGDAKLTGLSAGELGISISGSGDVGGTGTVAKITISIAGSGDVHLTEMAADDVSVSIAGSGDATVNASKTLSVSIAGSGDVTYTGNAALKSRVAGSGSVTKR